MFHSEPADEDFEGFINSKNRIMTNFTRDAEISSAEHVNKLEVDINTVTIVTLIVGFMRNAYT